MSLAAVHTAVVEYFQGVDLPYVNTPDAIIQFVEKQQPNFLFFPQDQPGLTTGAVMYTWMLDASEIRQASGPYLAGSYVQGLKFVNYRIGLNCFLRCNDPLASTAAEANETFIQAVAEAVRADRNAGTGTPGTGTGVVWQWGMGPSDRWGADIQWKQSIPAQLQGSGVAGLTEINTTFEITVVEAINA